MEPAQEIEYDESIVVAAPSPTKTAVTALHDDNDDEEEENGANGDGPMATANSSNSSSSNTDPTSTTTMATRMKKYLVAADGGKELLACLIVGGIFFGCGYLVSEPQERPIPYQYLNETGTYILDLSLTNAYDGDTIPDWAVILMVVLVPIVQMVLSGLVGSRGDMHRTACVYILSLTINDFCTWMLKAYAGYFRPSFYQLCEPDENYEYCTNSEAGYARDSFPSGHASFSFLSMTVLALYLERCFGISSIERAFVVMTPSTTDTQQKMTTTHTTKI